jgi:hypothetical protein
MFKAASGDRYAKRVKFIESLHFKLGVLLMFSTFLAGGVSPLLQDGGPLTIVSLGWRLADPILPVPLLQVASTVFCLAFLGTLSYLVVVHRRTRTAADPIWFDKPLAYLLFQSLGTLLPTIAFPLYAAALAIHYVEYHVLMYPRCFHSRLDDTSRLDRFFGRLRRSPLGFYVVLLSVAGLVTICSYAGMGLMGIPTGDLSQPMSYVALIAVFDGLFVFHYLVEAYIWRFSEPHYRESLGSLYFAPRR